MAPSDDPRDELRRRLGDVERELEALRDRLSGATDELEAALSRVREGVELIPPPPPPPAPPAAAPPAGADEDGARLVALDLVLRGTPRDEALLRLAADYPGVDAARLLDDAGATPAP